MAKFVDYITKASGAFWSNFFSFFGAMLLLVLVLAVLIVVASFAMAANYGLGLILVLLAIAAAAVIRASIYGMAAEALKKGKTSIGTLFSTFREKWATLLGIEIASAVIIALPLLLLLLVAGGLPTSSSYAPAFTGSVSIIVILCIVVLAVIIAVLILLAIPAAVCDGTGVIQSLKASFGVAKSHFASLFAMYVTFTIIGGVLGLIPVVGTIAVLLLIEPLATVAFTEFYLKSKA
ncbi:hypothetical protein H0O02_01365 [Candidatus Micrarchaeota archaeon]|nr:hypothetical protein [Candidatus Micrarchaeota archaeon]